MVDADTLKNMLTKLCTDQDVALLKLDIEGAEHEALEAIMNDEIFPAQIVEYDELRLTSFMVATECKKRIIDFLRRGMNLYTVMVAIIFYIF